MSALALGLFATMAMALTTVDVNTATAAELDAVHGIGPGTSGKILAERKKGDFKDWNDLITRVKGVGENNSQKFAAGGLTVNGVGMAGVAVKPVAMKESKADMYRLSVYYVCSTLSDMVAHVFYPTFFMVIVYFMAGFKRTVPCFFFTLLVMLLIVITSQASS